MIVRYNKNFERLVGSDFNIESVKNCSYSLFSEPVRLVETDGCYFFKKLAPQGKVSDRLNKMEFEFDNNKIRIDDLIDEKISPVSAFWCGLAMVRDLIVNLQLDFGKGFEVILSYNYEHCFVRFYKIREGINNVMSNDLEGFKLEAILRIII